MTAVLVLLTLVATVSGATSQGRVRLGGYGVLGDVRLDAAQTFEAVSDTSHAHVLGGGVEITTPWGFVSVDVAVSRMTIEGERLSIHDGGVQPPGIPLEVSMLHVDVAAGWRHVHWRLSLHVGGGVSRLTYETSGFAQLGKDATESGTGALFLAGVHFALLG